MTRPRNKLADLTAGKSVALVGNSIKLLDAGLGDEIDSHDVVIRMNRGLPNAYDSIGSKTTIWTVGRYWPDLEPPKDCELIMWMKLTQLGVSDYYRAKQHWARTTEIQWWSHADEQAATDFVGAPPGTGIRLLWWLKSFGTPRAVQTYGMDCWKAVSHWSGQLNAPAHDPDLERIAMEKLL